MMFSNVGDDILYRRAWLEHTMDTYFLQPWQVYIGDDAPNDHEHIVKSLLAQQLHHTGTNVIMGTRQNRQANNPGIFLQGRLNNLLRSLSETGVYDLHALVAQCARDDLRPAVVTIETRFSNDNPDFFHR
ncbi:uncharacterized protein METZ01_LOCUS76702 [marine metagenome]|uniref:Uncharacterized protein n=1 Tax=marine metagenome TaxID=408172 RepID=A0A381U8H0_9ZZZZ